MPEAIPAMKKPEPEMCYIKCQAPMPMDTYRQNCPSMLNSFNNYLNLLDQVMHQALLQSMGNSIMWLKADKKQDNQLLDAVNRQTRMIIGALNKNQRPAKVINKIDLGWADYLNKQI